MTIRTTYRDESLATRTSRLGNARRGCAPAPAWRHFRRRPAPTSKSRASGRSSTAFRFSGEYADDMLGLVYYNYRHYNPADGRWTSRDPLARTDNLFLFSFATFDRLGMAPVSYKLTALDEGLVTNDCGAYVWTVGFKIDPVVKSSFFAGDHNIIQEIEHKMVVYDYANGQVYTTDVTIRGWDAIKREGHFWEFFEVDAKTSSYHSDVWRGEDVPRHCSRGTDTVIGRAAYYDDVSYDGDDPLHRTITPPTSSPDSNVVVRRLTATWDCRSSSSDCSTTVVKSIE